MSVNNWLEVYLHDLCRPKQWKTISTKDLTSTGYTVYGANGIIGCFTDYTHEKPTLMITCRGATCGNLHISKPFSYINGNAMALDSLRADICNMRYLLYFLKYRGFGDVISGSAQPQITQEGLKIVSVSLVPLNEQKRIADKLDQLLAAVDSCKTRLDTIPGIIKRFRQSVVSSAVLGQLTVEWRSQQSESKDQRHTSSLGKLCQAGRVITYGVIKLGDEISDGVPCLRTSNVRWLRIEIEGIKCIAPSLSSEFSRTILQGTEVLVNVRGTLGGVAVASSEMKGWNVSREVAVIPVDTSIVDPDFLALWVASDISQRWLKEVQRGVAYVGINIEDLRTLPVELPPLDEQIEIVRRVEALFAVADRLETRYQAARAQVNQLTPSLLAKAFRGELVPQDPNDEPAEKLLERIRASKPATPAKRQTRRNCKQS